MNSALKSLIQQHKQQAQSLIHGNQQSSLADKLQKLGKQLLSLIIIYLSSEDAIKNVNDEILAKKKQVIMNKISNKHSQSPLIIERILGIFIKNIFQDDKLFWGLSEQICVFDQFEEDEDQQDQEQDQISVIDNSVMERQTNEISKILEESLIVSDHKHQQYPIDRSHKAKVNSYLYKLSVNPKTELGQMCQHFRWKCTFPEQNPYNPQSAIVELEYKTQRHQLIESAFFRNKKLSQIRAAYQMLRRIYVSLPQIWDIFSKIRISKPPTAQNTSPQLASILQSVIKEDKVQIIHLNSVTNIKTQTNISQYLTQIKCFREQMNELTNNFRDQFTHPKMQKFKGQLWNVQGIVYFKDKTTNEEKIYVQVASDKNSYTAEELVAKKLLTQIYYQNKAILERMVLIIAARNIRP